MTYETDDYRKLKATCEYWARIRDAVDAARKIEEMIYDGELSLDTKPRLSGHGHLLNVDDKAKASILAAAQRVYMDRVTTMLANPPQPFNTNNIVRNTQ